MSWQKMGGKRLVMYHPSFVKKLEGQEFTVNPNNNSVVLEITTPFKSAGYKAGWDVSKYGSIGFGVNQSIIQFVQDRKAHLVILLSNRHNEQHWINFDQIKQFMKNNPHIYKTHGKELIVLPWKIFSPSLNALGVQS